MIGRDAAVADIGRKRHELDGPVAFAATEELERRIAALADRAISVVADVSTIAEQYEAVLQVNLKSAFFGTQLAARQMIRHGGGGHIINITSVHEDWPMPGNIAYCLSKGGMRMLTRAAGLPVAA